MDAKKFGAFISDRRKQQHMTQAELAGKIGVTDKAVSRWERGLGFPDINTMEPLADALGISLLELMRSEVQDADNVQKAETMSREGWNSQKEQKCGTSQMDGANKNDGKPQNGSVTKEKDTLYTSAEVTEMMHTMEEIRKQQQHQDKMAGYLAIPVILIVTILTKLSGQASLGGAVFVGFLGAGPVVSGYYLWKNRADAESRRIYGAFTFLLAGFFLVLCSVMIPDSFWDHHAQGANLVTCMLNLGLMVYLDYHVLKSLRREKKGPIAGFMVLIVNILLVVWTLHGFAARSIENAVGTSRGDVAEQYATQLLINEKDLEEDWVVGYSYNQIDLHPDVYRVAFTYYANAEDAETGEESCYGYDIQVDSDYKITIKEESTAIGEDMWTEMSQESETEVS